jgi:hypothetical protein
VRPTPGTFWVLSPTVNVFPRSLPVVRKSHRVRGPDRRLETAATPHEWPRRHGALIVVHGHCGAATRSTNTHNRKKYGRTSASLPVILADGAATRPGCVLSGLCPGGNGSWRDWFLVQLRPGVVVANQANTQDGSHACPTGSGTTVLIETDREAVQLSRPRRTVPHMPGRSVCGSGGAWQRGRPQVIDRDGREGITA